MQQAKSMFGKHYGNINDEHSPRYQFSNETFQPLVFHLVNNISFIDQRMLQGNPLVFQRRT